MPTRTRKTAQNKTTTNTTTDAPEQPVPQPTAQPQQPTEQVETATTPPVKATVKTKTKVTVTPADLVLLTVVAAHQKNPTMRHLQLDGWVCPHFDQPDKQSFKTATPEQAETLKACSACATKAARVRLETAS